ncbi:hypothetical protein FQN50_005545 [Emmonsiellopsis sp. PD_5]|nr:hypothetical protein FQN50_005545 [Emmonsiellopsis sp. PD_5]
MASWLQQPALGRLVGDWAADPRPLVLRLNAADDGDRETGNHQSSAALRRLLLRIETAGQKRSHASQRVVGQK